MPLPYFRLWSLEDLLRSSIQTKYRRGLSGAAPNVSFGSYSGYFVALQYYIYFLAVKRFDSASNKTLPHRRYFFHLFPTF